MAQVTLKKVVKKYDETLAVRGIDLDIFDKEFVVLVGPSGCGKSTTLRMIAGLEEITDGEVMIGGDVVNDLPPKDRDIAMVFQNYALYPHMTVFENMSFGLRLKKFPKPEIKQRVEDAARILDITELLSRKPRQLSGGQRQRVAMGRAIVRHPKVFLFDEPLSNLDAKLRVQMRTEIKKVHQKVTTTTIYVTHDQVEAMTLADRVVVMNAGRIEQIGTQTDIYLRPRTPYVAEFIGANNGLPGTVTGREGDGDDARILVQAGTRELRCRGRDEFGAGEAVIAYVRPEDIEILDGASDRQFENVLEGTIDRVIFEGPTAQLRVEVDGRELRVDVSGNQRLTLMQRDGRIRLGFDAVTLIAAPVPA
jgi:ABC-type sugar transport system ATPase subunit